MAPADYMIRARLCLALAAVVALAPLALAFALSPAHAQTWKKLNTGIARDVSPNQIGVDIGTNASSYVSIGNIVAGAFYLPYTQVSGLYPYTAILAATAGKWADLQSDGSNWIIMASN